MPELPEVETTKNAILPYLKEQNINKVNVFQRSLRYRVEDDFELKVNNAEISDVYRRAKYIVIELEDSKGYIICHLGMSGSMRLCSVNDELKKHDHIQFILSNNHVLRYHDPRRFGCMLWTQSISTHPLMKNLGPEPLSDSFNAENLYQLSKAKKTSVKQFIMDQNIVVGVGNIYASESLFRAKISPKRKASNISLARYELLVTQIQNVLKEAIAEGGTTLRDFVSADGTPGYFVQTLNVYGRDGQPCNHCSQPIDKTIQGQRATYYCQRCQK